MGGSHFSRVNENAREQVLSGDLNRGLDLVSRDVQNALAYMGADLTSGAPFSGSIQLPAVTGDSGGFTATFGAGAGFHWNPIFPNLTADDSSYLVLRWPSTPLTFAPPDSTNPRIDLVVGDVTGQDTDLQSRNILVDPITRGITPQNVNKTSNPLTTLSVITGVAGALPNAPPAGAQQVALYEVYVPAGVANASFFTIAPRLWRKTSYPMSSMSGPVYGCRLTWDLTADPSTTPSSVDFGPGANACMIDGELISFVGSPRTIQDSTANPFATAAPATSSRPYYIYLVAGRNRPQFGVGSVGLLSQPIPALLVESTVPPDSYGRPQSNITTPRGTTTRGACYVGLGFVYRNTTNRQPCLMANGLTWAAGKNSSEFEIDVSATSPTTFASAPSGAALGEQLAMVRTIVAPSAPATLVSIGINHTDAGDPSPIQNANVYESVGGASSAALIIQRVLAIPLQTDSAQIRWLQSPAGTTSFNVVAWANGVRRLGR